MSLIECTAVEGGSTLAETAASVVRVRNAILVPIGLDHKPGLYDGDGGLVRAAAYFRGLPEPHFPLEAPVLGEATLDVERAPPGPRYVFAGHLTGHYGHFLFALLGRLWSLPYPVPSEMRLVLLNGANIHEIFELEFARTLFHAAGLTPDSFAVFRAPTRFAEIEVPEPSVEENHLGRPEFAALCHRLGARILRDMPPRRDRPIFLSKRRLKRGVHGIVNEDELCAGLAQRGFEIVSPETLPLRDQLALWVSAPTVAGIFGSMLHTSVFTPGRAYCALNPERWINSNQTIIDRLNGNAGQALFPSDGYGREPSPGFDHGLRLRDPEGVARSLARRSKQVRSPGGPLKGLRDGMQRLFRD